MRPRKTAKLMDAYRRRITVANMLRRAKKKQQKWAERVSYYEGRLPELTHEVHDAELEVFDRILETR